MGDTKKTRYHKRQRYRSRANNCKNARVRNPNFCKKTNVDNAPQCKHNTEDSDSVNNPKIRKRTNITDILKEYTQSLIGEQYEQYLEKKGLEDPVFLFRTLLFLM